MRSAEDADEYEIQVVIGDRKLSCRIHGKLWHSLRNKPAAQVANVVLHAINDGLRASGLGRILHLE